MGTALTGQQLLYMYMHTSSTLLCKHMYSHVTKFPRHYTPVHQDSLSLSVHEDEASKEQAQLGEARDTCPHSNKQPQVLTS